MGHVISDLETGMIINSTISMKLENHSDVRGFERAANYPEDLFPNFPGLVMRYRGKIFRFLDRIAPVYPFLQGRSVDAYHMLGIGLEGAMYKNKT